MVHLAGLPAGTRVTRTVLAQAAAVPENFMSKVLQDLVRARLIGSHRGMQGGFELALQRDRITLLDVVEAIEGPIQLNFCLAADQSCERQGWCAAHGVWAAAQQALVEVLRHATLDELARQSTEKIFNIAAHGDAPHRQESRPLTIVRSSQAG